jgi:predicted RNase H-like HicB family nuclease
MHRFLEVIEKANENYSAYSPDLPGCVATGATRHEAEDSMCRAIQVHIRGLVEDGTPTPERHSCAGYVAAG